MSEFAVKNRSWTSHYSAAMSAQLKTDMNVHPTYYDEINR